MIDILYASVFMSILVGIFIRQIVKCLGMFNYDTVEEKAEYAAWLKKESKFRLVMATISILVLLAVWIWFTIRRLND